MVFVKNYSFSGPTLPPGLSLYSISNFSNLMYLKKGVSPRGEKVRGELEVIALIACHTGFVVLFPLPSCCLSSLQACRSVGEWLYFNINIEHSLSLSFYPWTISKLAKRSFTGRQIAKGEVRCSPKNKSRGGRAPGFLCNAQIKLSSTNFLPCFRLSSWLVSNPLVHIQSHQFDRERKLVLS